MNDVTHTSSLENARPPAILFGQIQQLTTEGQTDAQIAASLGIGVGQIRRIALKNGLKLKREHLPQPVPADAVLVTSKETVTTPPTAMTTPPIVAPKRQRRPRQTAEVASSPRASNFEAASGLPGELLMMIGEITVLAGKNKLSPIEFIEQCRGYVAAWEKIEASGAL